MDPYFVRSLLKDTVLVKPHQIGSNYREVILHLLNKRFEGVCSRHGFIVPGSIAVHKINNAKVQAFSLNGDVCYSVQYYAGVCNPPVGSVLPARVINMNKFGVMAHSGIDSDDGTFIPVIESIVTRQTSEAFGTGLSSEVDLDSLKIGDSVFVEILGKKFELNDEKISVIGRVVTSSKPRKRNANASNAWDVVARQVEDDLDDPEGDEQDFDEDDIDENRKSALDEDKDGDTDDESEEDEGEEDDDEDGEEDEDGEDEDDEDESANEDELTDGDEDDEDEPKKRAAKGKDKDETVVVKAPAKKGKVPPVKKANGRKEGGSDAASEFFVDESDGFDEVGSDYDFGGREDDY